MTLSDVAAALRRRWRIAAGAVLLTAAVLGLYLFTRHQSLEPDEFTTDVQLLVPAFVQQRTGGGATQTEGQLVVPSEDVPLRLLQGQERMAFSEPVLRQAKEESGLDVGDSSVQFGASLNDARDVVTLSVTALDPNVSVTVADNYLEAFRDARREVDTESIAGEIRDRITGLENLRQRVAEVEAELVNRGIVLPPTPLPDANGDITTTSIVPPPGADLDTTLLLYEQQALHRAILGGYEDYATAAVESRGPSPHAQVLDKLPTLQIVAEAPSPVAPSVMIVLAGVAVAIAGAVLADRLDRKIRSVRVAAAAFSAPVLSTVPARVRDDADYAVLERPGSARSEAFRALAATSLATDRLPQAIVVSTPHGDTHDDIAANFAAALASMGLQVALVATSPSQSWYLEPFTPGDGTTDLPGLLRQAHTGRLDGQVMRRLSATDLTPNLFVVPPGPELDPSAPLDGLPPLLEALAAAGIDVTVIAGPALTDANATIVAWATRSVLWAMQIGKVTQDEATEAAARLELAGVNPFGVVVVGAAES